MARAPALGATSQGLQHPRIEPAPLRIRAASVTAAVNAGTKEFKLWYMVNIKKFSREYGHGRANYINGPRVAGARSLPAKNKNASIQTPKIL